MLAPRPIAFLAAFAVVLSACAGESADSEATLAEEMSEDPDLAPTGTATGLPAGYALRLDRPNSNPSEFLVMPMGGGLHVETGPAGILWDAQNEIASGDYTVSATFQQTANRANHPEAYGVFIGGAGLAGDAQKYTYFIVRGDGSYMIKKRDGAQTMNLTEWTRADAVMPTTGDAATTNALEVAVRGATVHFSVNGTEVATVPAADIDSHGIAGVRINHNLNVMVSDWTITRM